jgi:hypothetical protein
LATILNSPQERSVSWWKEKFDCETKDFLYLGLSTKGAKSQPDNQGIVAAG